MNLATPDQVDEWSKAWRVAVESGSQETFLAFVCRERGLAEEIFLQQLAQAMKWPFLDLPKRSARPLELALDLEDGDPEQERLRQHGWLVRKAQVVASTPWD